MTNASPTRADRPLQSAPGVCLTDAAPISFHRVAMKTHLQELLGSALDQLLAGTEAVRPAITLDATKEDRKCVVVGKSVSVRVDLDGRLFIKKNETHDIQEKLLE